MAVIKGCGFAERMSRKEAFDHGNPELRNCNAELIEKDRLL